MSHFFNLPTVFSVPCFLDQNKTAITSIITHYRRISITILFFYIRSVFADLSKLLQVKFTSAFAIIQLTRITSDFHEPTCQVDYSSIILPSVEITTTCQGINLPLCIRAFFTAFSIPRQQGTCIRTTVTLLILLSRIIAVSFSL